MTSTDNVEIVRRAYVAFNEGGFAAADARGLLSDDLVFEEPPEQPAPRVARGRTESLAMAGQFDEAWEKHSSEIEEMRELEDGRVFVLTIEHFRGRDGLVVDQPCGMIFTLRNGEIARFQALWERATAAKVAGVSL